jgi:hypothetical protein
LFFCCPAFTEETGGNKLEENPETFGEQDEEPKCIKGRTQGFRFRRPLCNAGIFYQMRVGTMRYLKSICSLLLCSRALCNMVKWYFVLKELNTQYGCFTKNYYV